MHSLKAIPRNNGAVIQLAYPPVFSKDCQCALTTMTITSHTSIKVFQKMDIPALLKSIVDHENIEIQLGCGFETEMKSQFDHVIWTGKLDEWFHYQEGHLSYRTLDFMKSEAVGDFQGTAVMNYGDEDVPYTRISEHKHFMPWENHEKTIYFKEYSRACGENDIPYYPIRLVDDKEVLKKYIELAKVQNQVTFAGRLATYRYMDMDVTIREALDLAKSLLEDINNQQKIASFYHQETL